MKNFQLIAVVLIAIFFVSNKAVAQCDDNPDVDWSVVPDVTFFYSGEGYCPNTSAVVDESDSGTVTEFEVTSNNTGNPDCDPDQAFITFADDFLGGCPETIERTWTVEYNTTNGGSGILTHVQTITLEDDVAPMIDNLNPVDVMISDACDETDAGVLNDSGFVYADTETEVNVSDFPGDINEDCIVSYNGTEDIVSYIDVYVAEGCPGNVGIIERTWTVTDECDNATTAVQMITLLDQEAPTITTCPDDVTVELTASCDENDDNVETITGFPYSNVLTMVSEADFEGTPGGVADDLCDANDILVFYMDSDPIVMEDNCPNAFISFLRTWTLEDACGNASTDVCQQLIELFDNVEPVIDTELPDFDETSMLNACDENDPNITLATGFPYSNGDAIISVGEFVAQGGMVSDNCNPLWEAELEISYTDVFTPIPDNCPDPVGELIRTWTVTDHCGNTTTAEQSILMFDTEAPTIDVCPGGGAVLEIEALNGAPCDGNNPEIEAQSGFAFQMNVTIVDAADFNAQGSAIDNCNGGTIEQAQYMDEIIGTGCETGAFIAFDFIRHWTVTDLCGNTATCDHVESIFCQAELDFPTDYMLPDGGVIMDNCSDFGNLQISYNPDITAGPVALAEGANEFLIVITDQCNNRYEEMFIVTMDCTGCGPDQVFETCDEPPTICDLNDIVGFNSCTPQYQGAVIENLCNGFVVNNPSYFEFIAGAEDVDLTVLPFSCATGGGVQAAIIDPCVPTMCYTDLGGACFTNETTVSATGLTVGNVYQLIVDGCGGDECNWTITNISATPFNIPDPSGEDQIAELPAFGSCDTEDLNFCQGSTIEFWPDTFEEALYFFCWSLDNTVGVTSTNGDEDCTENTALETTGQSFSCSQEFSSCGPLELTFQEIGEYRLCLTELENGCDNQAPPDYCWEITIIENGPIDFGLHYVCQHDIDNGWYPDVLGPNGEVWEGDNITFQGEFNNFVSDDCGCMFEHQIEVIVLPELPSIVELELCAYDLENFEDADLGLNWFDIEDYYNDFSGPIPTAFLDPWEEGSLQIAYNDVACDTFIQYEFYLYDVPGEIIQTPGPVCDIILSLDLDFSIFPEDLIDPEDLVYTWYDSGGEFAITESVSVTETGFYDLFVEYFLEDGSVCSFWWEDIEVNNFANPPAAPTFLASPNETCITEIDGIVYSVPAAANAEYLWIVLNGTFTPNAGNDEITISITDPAMTTTVCVSASSMCGDSPTECEDIIVTPSPIVELVPVMDVCVDQPATIATNITAGSADEFFWNIPNGNFTQAGSNMAESLAVSWSTPGTYTVEVSVEDAAGCQSNLALLDVNVLAPLDPPTASCSSSTSNAVEITIVDNPNAPDGSTFIVSSGQTATEDNGVVTVTGLVPGDDVTLLFTTLGGNHPCGDQSNQITCTATNCPLNPVLENVDAICLDGSEAPFQLLEIAGNPGGTWDGPGTDAASGMFDPTAAGPGTHVINYEVTDLAADCTASANVNIVVYPTPIEDFTPSVDTVCIGQEFSIAFEDNDASTYTWEFDDDNSNPTVDETDFVVSYSDSGNKTITMTVVTGPDCEYNVSYDVFVRPELVFPGVFCGGLSPVSVGFDWEPLAGVEEFEYEILINGTSSENGTTSETDFSVDGLSEGDEVEMIVTAIDMNGCSNPVASELCIAQDCPDFEVLITASETLLCFDPNGVTIQLDQTTSLQGALAIGTGEWSGSDLLDPITGEFTPDEAGVYVLSYVFTEDGTACPASESITIEILESPESEFTQDLEEICIEDVVTFTLEDDYNASYTYTWTSDFDESQYNLEDNEDGTFTLEFFEEGSGDFSLIVSVAGCESPETTASVEVGLVPELPVITCQEDLGYILFEWNEVDCIADYIVRIDGVVEPNQPGSQFELDNLGSNQQVEIEIEFISDCLCDFPSVVSATCTAQDCEAADITFDASVATTYCVSELTSFTYSAMITGPDIDNTGVFTWSGDGVDADGNVDFTGFAPGSYTISVTYLEDDCSYTDAQQFDILDNPEIIFDSVNAPCPGALGEVSINAEGSGPFDIVADGNVLESGLNQLQTGNYSVMITDSNGCVTEDSFSIGTDAEPSDDLLGPTVINMDSTGVFTYSADVPNIENITWTVNGEIVQELTCDDGTCDQLSFTSPAGGTYEVCAYAYYDGAVCELIECRTFTSNELFVNSVYIPNVITPDNDLDPLNKTLTMFVHGQSVQVNSVGIFDRWGNRVYFNEEEVIVNSGESTVLWDGTFEGQDFIAGVYVYLIDTEVDGIQEWVTDDITIVR